MARPIHTLDDYMDALDAGEVDPSPTFTCPECGGVATAAVSEVGDSLRVWISCAGCKGITHGDRGPKFPGWERLDPLRSNPLR